MLGFGPFRNNCSIASYSTEHGTAESHIREFWPVAMHSEQWALLAGPAGNSVLLFLFLTLWIVQSLQCVGDSNKANGVKYEVSHEQW